jgi:hypothetical protein
MWHARERREVFKVLMGKPEARIPLRRPRPRWDDEIRIDLREIGWRGGGSWLRIGIGVGLL